MALHPPSRLRRRRWTAVLALLPAASLCFGTPAPVSAAEPGADRITLNAAGTPAYRIDADVVGGGIVVTDNVSTFATRKIQGTATLPGAEGGEATFTVDITRGVLGLTGTLSLQDPGAGVQISAKVTGGVKTPADGTVTWQGNATVRRGSASEARNVSLTLLDRWPDPGDHAIRITHAGKARNAVLRLPDDYDGTPRPVLFHFPGLFETPGMAEFYGRMADYAQTRGFIMITPEHYGRGWQGVPAGTPSPDLDDPGFIRRLQDILITRFNADPARLYASGMSNGGFFTSRLACVNERFAAYAAVAGQLSDIPACEPGRKVPIVMLHGTTDTIVPYSTVAPAAAFWAGNNTCSATSTATPLPDKDPRDNTTVVRHVHDGCPADAPVELYEIKGGGHNWPGGLPFLGPFLGGTTHDIDANEVIWDFVSAFRLA
ncbi:hypothetical protein [Actinocorallia libanotica]